MLYLRESPVGLRFANPTYPGTLHNRNPADMTTDATRTRRYRYRTIYNAM